MTAVSSICLKETGFWQPCWPEVTSPQNQQNGERQRTSPSGSKGNSQTTAALSPDGSTFLHFHIHGLLKIYSTALFKCKIDVFKFYLEKSQKLLETLTNFPLALAFFRCFNAGIQNGKSWNHPQTFLKVGEISRFLGSNMCCRVGWFWGMSTTKVRFSCLKTNHRNALRLTVTTMWSLPLFNLSPTTSLGTEGFRRNDRRETRLW